MRKSAYFVQKVELCVNSLLLSHTQLHILLTFAYIFDICLLCTGSFPFPLRSGFFRSPLRLVQKIKQIPLADASGICIDFGGDGGSRTHVRKHFRRSFSERSWSFIVSHPCTPVSRLTHPLSYWSSKLLGAHPELSCIIDARVRAYREIRSDDATATKQLRRNCCYF